MAEQVEFYFEFPVFIVVDRDEDTCPTYGSKDKDDECVLLFTDEDNCKTFLDRFGEPKIHGKEILDGSALRRYFEAIQNLDAKVVLDPMVRSEETSLSAGFATITIRKLLECVG